MIGAAVFAALGTATASVIRSAEGSSAVVNFILLPMAFLSGAFGPTPGYPAVLRAIGDVLPLTYLVKLVDAVYLHGHAFWTQPGGARHPRRLGRRRTRVHDAFKFRWEPRGRYAVAGAEYVTVTDAWICCVPASIGGAALAVASIAGPKTIGVAWPPSVTFSTLPSVRPVASAITCAFALDLPTAWVSAWL